MEDVEYAARIDRLVALRRARAAIDAEEQCLLHELISDPPAVYLKPNPALDKQWVRDEVACALQIAPMTAASKIVLAGALVTRLPETLQLLAAGDITMRHALKLVEAVLNLPDEATAAIQARILPRAAQQTPSQFGQAVRRAVLRFAPRTHEQQRADALADRRVCFTPLPDGSTELWALLPAETAAALQAAIDTRADQLKATDDPAAPRTADQRRADALIELALGSTSVLPIVNVTVALSTLLDLDAQPGELGRHGPIPAALARELAFEGTGTWRRLLTDEAGQVIDVGRSSYRPPSRLAKLVVARQTTCVFPGCRRTAARCELDHIRAWDDDGGTSAENLQPLCPRHHHLKHEAGWEVWRLADGTTRWRAPSGRRYDRPPDEIPRDTTTDPPGRAAA